MNEEISIGIFDLIIFLGVVQGLFISWFYLTKSSNHQKSNLYQGLLILAFSLGILEELLNNTGYIVKILEISNFSEPLNFIYAPLLFLYVKSTLGIKNTRYDWVHFVWVLLWAGYMIFYFVQSNEFKYNSYVYSKHPDWDTINVIQTIPDDPLGIRNYINHITFILFIIYLIFTIRLFIKELKKQGERFFSLKNTNYKILRNTIFHFSIIMIVFLFSKLYFGRDLGDYLIATYVSFIIFYNSYRIVNNSPVFDGPNSFLNYGSNKYKKSSLTEERMNLIHKKIISLFNDENFYSNNLVSLSNLSKKIGESKHHTSQVINEKFGLNFYELLAKHRVELAKKLIKQDNDSTLTVEILAEKVGYNSRSSFNKAFKKFTGQTPSEYRVNT